MAGVENVSVESNGTSRFVIETDTSVDMRPQIASMAVQKGCGLLELSRIQLSLEDIFMQLVTEEPSGEGTEQ
ncbi:MAG: ABC transporter ATP-binding protein, partial [Syntrophobacteraceae bacterium]